MKSYITSINIGNGKQKFFRYMGGEFSHRFYAMDRKIGVKSDLPEIDDYIDYDRSIIFADFDELPVGFDNWDAHREYISYNYGHVGFVFPSASGKTKIAVVTKGIHLSDRIKRDTLRSIFGDDIAGAGMGHNDMSMSFIRPESFRGLGDFIRSSSAVTPVRDHQVSYISLPSAILSDCPEVVREIVTHIASFGNRAIDGVDCPQRYIAEAFNRSQSTVSVAIRDAESMGLIKCVDDTVCVGRKAKTYSIGRVLFASIAVWACLSISTQRAADPKNLYRSSPLTLLPGGWYSGLWAATNYFMDEPSFLEWANSESRDPLKHRERMKMASRAWANHIA